MTGDAPAPSVGERLRTLGTLVRLLPPASGPLTIAAVALVLVAPLVHLASALAAGHLIGSVPPAIAAGVGSDAAARLDRAVLLVAALVVLAAVESTARQSVASALGRRVDRVVRRRVLDAVSAPAGIAHLEDPVVADRVALARTTTLGFTPGLAADGLVAVAASRLMTVVPVALLASYRWWLPVLVVPPAIWFSVATRRHVLHGVEALVGAVEDLRHTGYTADLALAPAAAKDVRVFGLARWLRDRYRARFIGVMTAVWASRTAGRRRLLPPMLAAGASQALGLWLIVRAATRGEVDLAHLAILLRATGDLDQALSVQQGDLHLQRGLATLPAVDGIAEAVADAAPVVAGGAPADGRPRSSIRFEGVRFRYPGGVSDVYDGLDLEIDAGSSLAIVGANGAGKTTLVKLLARLYDPVEGRITVDGTDLRHLDASDWQRRVAAIFQDFTRYELSAADNVGFGALDLAGDRTALDEVAEQAGITEVIGALDAGWDTPLSRRFSGGTDLSGGQWQRVALARALLAVKGGAGILVLDEPTAHLDVRAEAELYDRFLELTSGTTTVVISHRFSTVRRADRIVVLDGGRVTESGTHDELVALGGTYARMFALQSARYAEDEPDAPGESDDAVA